MKSASRTPRRQLPKRPSRPRDGVANEIARLGRSAIDALHDPFFYGFAVVVVLIVSILLVVFTWAIKFDQVLLMRKILPMGCRSTLESGPILFMVLCLALGAVSTLAALGEYVNFTNAKRRNLDGSSQLKSFAVSMVMAVLFGLAITATLSHLC